eukprot:Partr_v1_DN24225_c0_g1_i1_m36689 putative Exosome complex
MRGHGTFGTHANQQEDNNTTESSSIFAAVAGHVDKVNKLITVQPSRSRYVAEVGDVVVGRIIECVQKRWRVDIRGCTDATLHLAAVNLPGGAQRRKLESDELQMRTFFKEGDLLVAEIQQTGGVEGNVALHTRSLKYGKLRNGMLVSIGCHLVQRSKSHFLQFPMGVDVVVGVNGLIWICHHVAELTMEQVERDSSLLYTDECAVISPEQRMSIARMANCVKAVAGSGIQVSRDSLMLAYELSLAYHTRELIEPSVQSKWILKVQRQLNNNLATQDGVDMDMD